MPAVPPPNPQRNQGSAQRLPSAQPGAAKSHRNTEALDKMMEEDLPGLGEAEGAATVIESAADAGQTVLQPAAGDGAQTVVEDELALEMPVRQEEQKGPQPPRGPRKMPQAVSGKPTEFSGGSSFLAIGGIVLVAVVFISIYLVYFGKDDAGAARPPAPVQSGASGSRGPVTAPAPAGGKPAPGKPVPATSSAGSAHPAPAKPAFDPANPANRGTFLAFLKFWNYARGDGQEEATGKLADKLRAEVSLAGVDDPDVKALHAKALELLTLTPTQSAITVFTRSFGSENPDTPAQVQIRRKQEVLREEIKGLSGVLQKRYGTL